MTEAAAEEAPQTSLYQRILDDIRGRIVSGEWAPGTRIPYEHELTAAYNCSRMTVNKALSQLAKSGLIERRRRSGSFVTRPRSQAAVLEIHDIKTEVEALGLPYAFEVGEKRMRKANREDRERLGLSGEGQVVELSCRHLAGKRPFCLEERVINLAAVPDAADERFIERAPGPWLVSRVPWSMAEHAISAVPADGRIAVALGIAEGAACLVIERRTWSAENPVTHVRLIYPGDSHRLVARFSPSAG